MRVMFVCHRFPYPPKRGGKIRPFNIIRHLRDSGHSVTVASLVRSAEEEQEGQGLVDFCDRILVGRISPAKAALHTLARLPTTTPSSMGYFYSRSLHLAIAREIEKTRYDLIFVHCSSAAQYVERVADTPSIMDFGDMDSQKWYDYSAHRRFPLNCGYWLEAVKLKRQEKRLSRSFDVSTCTTPAELATLQSYGSARATNWFPNGVDNEFFSPTGCDYDPNLIVFVGRMDYYPNCQAMLQFCEEVFPRILSARPSARLKIVGAEPTSDILRLREQRGVEVTGTVADVREHANTAALSVAPLRIARGTQNKVLESMAMGVPTVCSVEAAGGVDAEPGRHLITANSIEDYVEAILRIMGDSGERDRLARAGRERVLTHHSWKSSMRKLDEIISSALASENRRAR